ncbi:hypothetical protein [Nocardia terpenica]|uniref:Uncharacterized protein n=1 Tax=Nocardia terpenica TaxID=455432 RepID=A0A164H394_9NOCA|nr:hypothetical protein [Nocardia terpenica]KZM68164.1 hypothetical protein AWN90_09495 [Nocardia terpenica]NQE88977.1 hypothetical protein [Nocardia terpenica]
MESDHHDNEPEQSADRSVDGPPVDDPQITEWVAKMVAAAERAGYRLHPDSCPPHTLLWQRATDDPTADPVWVDDLPDCLR